MGLILEYYYLYGIINAYVSVNYILCYNNIYFIRV